MPMISGGNVMQPYEARSFRFLELWSIGDWRMKLYGIGWRREHPRHELIEAAKGAAAADLEKVAADNYSVGFVGVHDGRDACFVFVDFWGNENELFHHVFLSQANDPAGLTAATDSDSSVCVWDVHLQGFERDAWIKHVLCKPNAPDFEAYLAERLNADV
jgi:hypothetical protein